MTSTSVLAVDDKKRLGLVFQSIAMKDIQYYALRVST